MTHARENQQLGAFRLLRRIGSGRMGEVWLAEDTRLSRSVAVRILPDSAAAARMRLAARLSHPSIAAIHAVGECDGLAFAAMEFVDGLTLDVALQERKLSDYDVVRVARDIADALAAAHERGIVHGDLGPDKVAICGQRVKVLGFGLGGAAEARTDIVSLGALLYFALGGVRPSAGDEPLAFYSLRPDLPQELAKVIANCRQKDHYAAHELAAALERVLPRLSRTALPVTPTMTLGTADAAPAAAAEPVKRMLVADDDPAIRRLFETLAKRQGIECATAANGPEAIAALKRQEYDLMFLDLMMPRIDGWGVLDYLRAHPRHAPMLFIITAFLDQNVSAADRAIVTGILYKPVDAEEIAALMRACVRGNPPAGTLRNTRHQLIA